MKEYVIAFFISFGFSTGAMLTFYLVETVKSGTETIAYLNIMRTQMKEVEALSNDCAQLIEGRRKGLIKVKVPAYLKGKLGNRVALEPTPGPAPTSLNIVPTPPSKIAPFKPKRKIPILGSAIEKP